ncbi:MAG: FAD-dependent oxidoreductase [Streptococcaceae bacterium]|jgi:NADPH-dependent 2,4-dienoyl-CoA reductase/sulfur reductase-like enzyme|nr:FAD-dependent oxidoreductase [Streptococcaceae bacterium]
MRAIVIGGNHAGIACANRIREEYPEVEVVIFEKKDEVGFVSQTIPLFLMGAQDIHSQANYAKPDDIRQNGIDLRINTEVIEISAKEKRISYREVGKKLREDMFYDKLVMATGSYPDLPPTGGELGKTLFLLKERKDAEDLNDFVNSADTVGVIGGGLVGVEISRIFAKRGLKVTVIQSNPRLLDKYLDDITAMEVEEQMQGEGIKLLLGTRALDYETIKEKLWRKSKVKIMTTSGETVEVDGVCVSIGFKPNSFLLSGQVKTGDRGAILVDEYMQSSDPDILAVGDCATSRLDLIGKDIYNPHASDAFRQGLIAAINLFERKKEIGMTTGTYKFNMQGFTIASTGITYASAIENGFDADYVHYRNSYIESEDFSTIHLVYERKTHKILGFQVIGTADISSYVQIVSYAIQKGANIEDLEFTDFFFEHGYKNPLGFTKILASLVREKAKSEE